MDANNLLIIFGIHGILQKILYKNTEKKESLFL